MDEIREDGTLFHVASAILMSLDFRMLTSYFMKYNFASQQNSKDVVSKADSIQIDLFGISSIELCEPMKN